MRAFLKESPHISRRDHVHQILNPKKRKNMPLMTPEQFEESLKSIKPRVFMNGKRVDNILENKNTRTVVEASLDTEAEDGNHLLID
jgi:hypothetical protein